jgi:hypothetical protein
MSVLIKVLKVLKSLTTKLKTFAINSQCKKLECAGTSRGDALELYGKRIDLAHSIKDKMKQRAVDKYREQVKKADVDGELAMAAIEAINKI